MELGLGEALLGLGELWVEEEWELDFLERVWDLVVGVEGVGVWGCWVEVAGGEDILGVGWSVGGVDVCGKVA